MANQPGRRRNHRGDVRATIRHVAEVAQVSTATVSRVFSSSSAVRAHTRERVLATARSLGYRPNRAARSLVMGHAGLLGLIVPDLTRQGFATLAQAAAVRAHGEGFALAVADRTAPQIAELALTRDLARRCDGVVLCSPDVADDEAIAIGQTTAVVVTQRRIRRIPTLLVNEHARARAALNHLRELGHQRVMWVAGPAEPQVTRDRVATLEATPGLQILRKAAADGSFADGFDLAAPLVASGATAAVALDGEIARGLLCGLARAGVAVPREMSIVGGSAGAGGEDAPTSIAPPLADMGCAAIELLLMVIRDQASAAALRTVKFEPRLEVGASTGPAASRPSEGPERSGWS